MRDARRSALLLAGMSADRALIAKVLRSAGVDVLEETSSDDGLDLARDRLPDLIIADLNTVMDGDEFTLAVRADPAIRETPVVFCGERQDESELWRLAVACGASRILIRPCEPEAIARVIGDVMGT